MSFSDFINRKKEEEELQIKQAYERVEKKYHPFLTLLPQNEKVANYEMTLDEKLKSLGLFTNNGATYLSIKKPYMSIDGRVQMAVDEAMKEGKPLEIGEPSFNEIGGQLICSVRVKTPRGIATGSAKVGIGGSGVDRTNPIENAETSAIGRALGFLGYGLVATGIASAEEVINASDEVKQLDNNKPKTQKKDNGTNEKPTDKLSNSPDKREKTSHKDNAKDNEAKATDGQIKYIRVLIEQLAKKTSVSNKDLEKNICDKFKIDKLEYLLKKDVKIVLDVLKEKVAAA